MDAPAPPAAPALESRATRVRGPVLVAAAVGVASVALHLRDPHEGGSWGTCPWLAMTGQ